MPRFLPNCNQVPTSPNAMMAASVHKGPWSPFDKVKAEGNSAKGGRVTRSAPARPKYVCYCKNRVCNTLPVSEKRRKNTDTASSGEELPRRGFAHSLEIQAVPHGGEGAEQPCMPVPSPTGNQPCLLCRVHKSGKAPARTAQYVRPLMIRRQRCDNQAECKANQQHLLDVVSAVVHHCGRTGGQKSRKCKRLFADVADENE